MIIGYLDPWGYVGPYEGVIRDLDTCVVRIQKIIDVGEGGGWFR